MTNKNLIRILDNNGNLLAGLRADPKDGFVRDLECPGAQLPGAVIDSLVIECGFFDDANLEGATISNSDFTGVWINGVNLRESSLTNTLFYEGQSFELDLAGSRLTNIRFRGANLSNANMSNCLFRDVEFEPDNILYKTDVSGANFTGTDLAHTVFRDTLYDERTVFPAGFDPAKVLGLIFQSSERDAPLPH